MWFIHKRCISLDYVPEVISCRGSEFSWGCMPPDTPSPSPNFYTLDFLSKRLVLVCACMLYLWNDIMFVKLIHHCHEVVLAPDKVFHMFGWVYKFEGSENIIGSHFLFCSSVYVWSTTSHHVQFTQMWPATSWWFGHHFHPAAARMPVV